jgi:hypothetical protein
MRHFQVDALLSRFYKRWVPPEGWEPVHRTMAYWVPLDGSPRPIGLVMTLDGQISLEDWDRLKRQLAEEGIFVD